MVLPVLKQGTSTMIKGYLKSLEKEMEKDFLFILYFYIYLVIKEFNDS